MTEVMVSVGTDHHPFERLLDWAVQAQTASNIDVFVQRGATAGRPELRSVDYLAQDELDSAFEAADVVVCHGGPGTIAAARRHGHRPIVVARDPAFGEHVDDHQMRYARKLADEEMVDLAADVDELIALITAPRDRANTVTSEHATAEAVREFGLLVDRLMDGGLPKRRWRDRVRLRRSP